MYALLDTLPLLQGDQQLIFNQFCLLFPLRPLFMAALGRAIFNIEHGQEGFVILTSSSDQGMVDIHDRRPVVPESDVSSICMH
ncbi:hypothetical protein KXR87_18105 [Yokenella regensburgei]|uniref:hypothetical protein n=1 Tax=Yokenella regensburgei TaxID=158877 RepID=UPI003F183623